MGMQKIGGFGQLLTNPVISGALAPGQSFLLPAGQGVIGTWQQPPTGPNAPTGFISTGQFNVDAGPFTDLQTFDPVLLVWRSYAPIALEGLTISSDGTNYRLSNTTGCPVGAVLTNVGSGYTNGFYGYNYQGNAVTIQNGITTAGNTGLTITPSAGGSLWNAIVGGSINTIVTITSGGTGYKFAPIIVFNPPANQG
ncbi:hypothetical protein, partial [Paludibacterium sp.]|uniref:hypothetical protein n=1 Tax=Paludibacterium sp. TaxID=1917523 RepID=UPI0025DCA8A0